MQHFNPKLILLPRKLLLIFSFSLLLLQANSQVFPMDTIMRNGERPNRINLVYLSDGYTAANLNNFVPNATAINTALFSQAPYQQYKNFFNSYAVKSPSNASGAKHPGTASDEGTSGGQPVINPDNYYGSTFDYFSIHRLLVPQNAANITGALTSNLPDYDQAFVVVNSTYYGGSGGEIATASTDPSSTEVAIHELGHSFAGLADEYWAGVVYTAEKPNMTQNNNPSTIKWKNWYGINGIGAYSYGNTVPLSTWYKPHQLCKMQYLGYPFCSVCAERIVDRIHELVNLIDTHTPAATSITLTNTDALNLAITKVLTNPTSINVKWYLNGSPTAFATDVDAVNIAFGDLLVGTNTIKAEVIDNNTLSKSYLPGVGYINSLTWMVNKPSTLPIHLKSFAGKIIGRDGILNWEIDDEKDLQNFELEKSRDGNNFTFLASIPGEDLKKSYGFTDDKMFLPYSYYRLKTTEKSGSIYYSSVVRLQNAFGKLSYKVYQDADLHKYHLSCVVENNENVALKIIDAAGRQVYRKSFGKTEQQLEYDVNLQGKSAGIYFMIISIGQSNYTIQLLAN